MRALHIHGEPAAGAQVLAEEARRGALIGAVVALVTQHADREVRLGRMPALRRGEGIEPRLHAAKRADEIADARPGRREFEQRIEDIVHSIGLGVRVILGELGKARAIHFVLRLAGEQPVKLGARRAQVAFARQRVTRADHRAVRETHPFRALGAQYGEQQLDFVGIALRPDAERVAGRVREAGAGEIDHHVARVLLRARGGKRRAGDEARRYGRVAPIAALHDARARRRRRRGLRRAQGDELLQLPGGVAAAGHAFAEIGLRPRMDRFGVRLAEITALPAIELAHRCHELALERPARGELHALIEREGRVMPGELLLLGRRHRHRGSRWLFVL